MRPEPPAGFAPDPAALSAAFAGAPAEEVIAAAAGLWPGRLAVVSSFGAEAAVLLHLVTRVDPGLPVLLIDTEMLFPQTLAYQGELAAWLGLRDVRRIGETRETLRARDPYGALHLTDPDGCCRLRKVAPLARALGPFGAWVSGRKRVQGGRRAAIALFEADGARVKVNPLAAWSRAALSAHMEAHGLPRHPLVAAGYPSIGCVPCTSPAEPHEDPRAGRWRGLAKRECGIHLGQEERA